MYKVILKWNLLNTNDFLGDESPSENYRGYNSNTFLPGEWLTPLSNREIRILSVSNIADIKCPTRRDLYYRKGKNRVNVEEETWGSKAGVIVEDYIKNIFNDESDLSSCQYAPLADVADRIHNDFLVRTDERFSKLEQLESNDDVNTEWFKKLLNCTTRTELALKVLHSHLTSPESINPTQILINNTISPHIEIGINISSSPDFIIPEHAIVGDIKSGVQFEGIHQLTCAGYALAYENAYKRMDVRKDMNWGIIYFLPTRNPMARVKPITFPQVYLFPIDDYLRDWFLSERDNAYKIISKEYPPDFPSDNIEKCQRCKFFNYCISQGLE